MSRHPKLIRVARELQHKYSLDYAKQAKQISVALHELKLLDQPPQFAVEHAVDIARKSKTTFNVAAAREALLAGARAQKMQNVPGMQYAGELGQVFATQAWQMAPQTVPQAIQMAQQTATQAGQQSLAATVERIFSVSGATILRRITSTSGTLIGIDVTIPPSVFNQQDWEEATIRRLRTEIGPNWTMWVNPTSVIELRVHGLPGPIPG